MSLRITSLASVVALAALIGLSSRAQAQLTNGGFEFYGQPAGTEADHNDASITPAGGWLTTEPDHQIEVWGSGFNGVPAFAGTDFVELNANAVGTLYQDKTGIAAGQTVGFHFAHRGRAGDDTMEVDITDLGADGVLGGGDDTVLFSKQYTDGISAWGFYDSSALPPITTLGNTIQFSYISISSVGGPAVGNFLDDADFGLGVGAEASTPEPGSIGLMIGLGVSGLGVLVRRRKRARKTA